MSPSKRYWWYEVNMAKVRADAKCTWYRRVRVMSFKPIDDLIVVSISKIPSRIYKDTTSGTKSQQSENVRRDGREFLSIDY